MDVASATGARRMHHAPTIIPEAHAGGGADSRGWFSGFDDFFVIHEVFRKTILILPGILTLPAKLNPKRKRRDAFVLALRFEFQDALLRTGLRIIASVNNAIVRQLVRRR